MIIKWKPGNVNLAGRFEYTWGQVETAAIVVHYHVGSKRAVETFVGTGMDRCDSKKKIFSFHQPVVHQNIGYPDSIGGDSQIGNSTIVTWIPAKIIVHPLLQVKFDYGFVVGGCVWNLQISTIDSRPKLDSFRPGKK